MQGEQDKVSVFHEVASIYRQALQIDLEDVEANFNMGILYLAGEYLPTGTPDYNAALNHFLQAVKKDVGGDISTLLRS
jgi:TPR repeat protein